jgi:CheY-like chemotaxis protein
VRIARAPAPPLSSTAAAALPQLVRQVGDLNRDAGRASLSAKPGDASRSERFLPALERRREIVRRPAAQAALEAFRAEPKRFDLVLTDETMPDLTGTVLAREIWQLRPEISIILMSGYSGAPLSERALAAGVIDVLHKLLIRRDTAGIVHRYGVVNLLTGLVTLSLVPLASIEPTM